jgi:hypothetical protein
VTVSLLMSIGQGDHQSGAGLEGLLFALQFGNYISTRLVTGQQLIDALENGVSLTQTVQGRFPQVCDHMLGCTP